MNSQLGDYVRRIRTQKNMSLGDVSRQSALFGKRISGSYIGRIENNPRLQPTVDRLKALANGLGVPPQELFAHAIGMAPNAIEDLSLLTKFRELSPERKTDVIDIVDMLYSKQSKRKLHIVSDK